MSNKTIELTKQLIACESVTPVDAGCQKLIAEQLKSIGFSTVDMPFGDVSNLWASHGTTGPHFVFAGHTDVVPAGDKSLWESDPFTPTVRDGKLYGRGVADMKGGIAAMICATKNYVNKNPSHTGTISFLLTSDEEGPAIDGTVKVMAQLEKDEISFDYCIVGEPISQNSLGDIIKTGSRGSLTGLVTFTGKQGHVGYPHQANNPAHATLSSINELPGITGLQITNLNSGVGAENVIPELLTCQFNVRFAEGVAPEQLKIDIETILKKQSLPYEVKWTLNGVPYTSATDKLTAAAIDAITKTTNAKPELSVLGGTSDARFIINNGCEVLEIGLLNETIHAVNENVNCDDLEKLTLIYEAILENILGNQPKS